MKTDLPTDEDISQVLTGIMASIDKDNGLYFKDLAQFPAINKALVAARNGDFDGFYFGLPYRFGRVIDGLLSEAFPGQDAHAVRFLFKHHRFIESHFRFLIERHEGSGCCADKTSTITRGICHYLTTGKQIEFDYTQKWTFHLPRLVFRDHESIMDHFNALRSLHGGSPLKYLESLQKIENGLKVSNT